MMEGSPSKLNMLPQQPSLPPIANASLKRPAPSLLPAFEPLSSSPGSFQRPAKRICSPAQKLAYGGYTKYPTPMPTSTTGIMSSSPPRVQGRPFLGERTTSMTSERAPLASVPTVVLPEDGQAFKMGRSSNSSHYQLSANKLISRVHVTARYIASTAQGEVDKVEISCMGWNGMKVHCHGRSWDLAKGDSFTSETESADIMLDVQDARVFVAWPERRMARSESESSWAGDEENSPVKAVNGLGIMLPSSPTRFERKLASPESPTPAGPAKGINLATLFSSSPVKPAETFDPNATIQVFEDADSDNEPSVKEEGETAPFADLAASQSSELSEGEVSDDPDEENDPVVHSFGPFGANISNRMSAMGMPRFTAGTPEADSERASQQSSAPSSPSPAKVADKPVVKAPPKPYVNHAVNQLAFSRLQSTPLSVILSNLPSDLRGKINGEKGISKSELHVALIASECVGEIRREGKDAAGQPLESEYYYIPDKDTDEQRRATVVDGLRKPSLRNCRKSHKQYYWKKPRTP